MSGDKNKNDLVLVYKRESKKDKAKDKDKETPLITLWGLDKYLFSDHGEILPLERMPEDYEAPNSGGCSEAQMEVYRRQQFILQNLFGGTGLDPFGKGFFSGGSARKYKQTQNLWHHKWIWGGKDYSPKALDKITPDCKEAQQSALKGLTERIREMVERCEKPDGLRRLETVVDQMLDTVCAECTDVAAAVKRNCPVEEKLALLFLTALLYTGPLKGFYWLKSWKPELGSRPPIPKSVFTPGESIFSVGEIDPDLLPDLTAGGKRFSFRKGRGSALRQILEEASAPCRLYVHGTGDETTVSGMGKSTTLRYLYEELPGEWEPLFVPLAAAYSKPLLEWGGDNLLELYLSRHYPNADRTEKRLLLLLDGLDELGREAVRRFCNELKQASKEGCSIVITAKTAPENLPSWEVLYDWYTLWDQFTYCTIHPLREEQRKAQGETGGELLRYLNTPFLVCLHRENLRSKFEQVSAKYLKRWDPQGRFSMPPENDVDLFYRALIARIVRNIESAEGNERQGEMDAFFMLRTLPAIAFQTLLEESSSGEMHPAAGVTIDREYVSRMIRLSMVACWKERSLFPESGGRKTDPRVLAKGSTIEQFETGQACGLLLCHQEDLAADDPFGEPQVSYRFLNNSIRDYMAGLHIANVFLMACADSISNESNLGAFYGCTMEYLMTGGPVAKAVDFVRLFLPEGQVLEDLLREQPRELKGELSRFLRGHIASRFARTLSMGPETILLWEQESFAATQMEGWAKEKETARRYGVAQCFALVGISRRHRQLKHRMEAARTGAQLCRLEREGRYALTANGQHMVGKVLLEWAGDILNCAVDREGFDSRSLFLSLDPQIFPWLEGQEERLKALEEQAEACKLTPELEQAAVEPVLSLMEELEQKGGKVEEICLDMLQRALRLYEAYRDSAPHIRFARLAALRGKAMSICSAVAEGASGAALNLLGVMTESDIAASLENDPHLPVFKEQPELHIPVEGLTDGERFPKAFVLLDRVYNIPRGQQAYAARKVSELLMRRVVRLEGGRPCTCTAGVPFVQEELEYLRKSTERAAASELSAVAYWRARFLWDERGDGQRDAAGIRELLRQEWKRCHCPQMVEEGRLNLQAVLIAVERLALDVQAFDAAEKDRLCRLILDWFRNWPQRSRQVRFHLGTGEHLEYRDDALWRLRRFGEHLPSELVRAVEQEICP